MHFFYLCLLIGAGLEKVSATPLHLPSILEDGASRAVLEAATPTMVQFIGRSISLKCSVPNFENFSPSWSKLRSNDGIPRLEISNGSELRAQDSRYSLLEDSETSTVTLQIRNLKTTDAGLYQCSVVSPNGDRHRANSVELQILQ